MAQGIVDLVILVDDASRDETVGHRRAVCLTTKVHVHARATGATAATRRPATAWPSKRGRHRHHGPSRLPVHARS
ncbi:MAG: hypothetical protein MZV49_25710 [Rhodopseudomonas palustris]|nr:hypothetical protein [Rhodopseudomonas palustris]